MATRETVTQSQRFYCVSLTPDLCKTPVGSATPPLPYTIKGEFSQATSVSPNVKSQGAKVLLNGKSTVPTTTGDNPGSAGGVKSGTTGSKVETKDFSSSVTSNLKNIVREGDMVWMNAKNTIGKVYERGVKGAKARIKDLGNTANEALADAKEAAKPYAQDYKDNLSQPLHEAGQKAMDVGGKVGLASGGVALAGAGVAATGVGLPVAAAMEATAAAGGTVAGVTTGVGAVTESGATVADQVADYILTGKAPDVVGTATTLATNLAESVVLKKLGGMGGKLTEWAEGMGKKLFGGKGGKPGKPPAKTPPPPPPSNSKDGGKHQPKKEEPADKPASCCTKNKAPGGKKARSRRPVHFGTGEEILEETDFVTTGVLPLAWTRTYRSGSEAEDWGLLGARWATEFTASISAHRHGIVVHEATGRALRLPPLSPGEQHDHACEGFTLRCDDHGRFTLTWRDGGTDTYEIGEGLGRHGWLPHGHDGVNAMLDPAPPLRVLRYVLRRSQRRDGQGYTVQHHPDAPAGGVLLSVAADDGTRLEAFRDPGAHDGDTRRIGRVDELCADGRRVTRAVYRYESELRPETTLPSFALTAAEALPLRHNLVSQTNVLGHTRHYRYRHHLLVGYTTFGGFAHGLEWLSLAALRARWAGSALPDDDLVQAHPIRLDNSYQARAVRTFTEDGTEELRIGYVADGTTRVTEPDGAVLVYQFNPRWLVTGVQRVGADGRPRSLGRMEWGADSHLVADIDAAGNATRYGYDAQGNLSHITDAAGHTTRIVHDAGNQPVAVTNALGHTTRRDYDALGRLTAETDALGRTSRFHYDDEGRLDRITDAKGGDKTFRYDTAGRLTELTDCSGHTTAYRYDTLGNVESVTAPDGAVTRHTHDALGRLTAIAHPADANGRVLSERFEHDADGNVVSLTDTAGQVTRFRYNGQGLATERTDPNGRTLHYRYDNALRLTAVVNGNGETYTVTYDVESRVASETSFAGKVTTYTYDEAGQLVAADSAGQRTDYLRDAMGRLVAQGHADGVVRFAYDAVGRMTAVAAPHAEQRYVYDAAGQLIEERTQYTLGTVDVTDEGIVPAAPSAAFTLAHAYDELGNRIRTTLPNGRRVDTLRYGSGHWHGTLWQGQSLVDVERDALHQEVSRQLGVVPRGVPRLHEERRRDPQARLVALRLSLGTQTLHQRRLTFDDAGHLTQIADTQRGLTDYAFDPLGQLLRAVQPHLAEHFAFDPAGNLLDASSTPPASPLPAVTHNLLQRFAGAAYVHDAQGNTVLKRRAVAAGAADTSSLALRYDSENRLAEAVRRAGDDESLPVLMHAHYLYDGFGRRIAKRVTDGTTGEVATTLFVWDGDALAQEISARGTTTTVYEPDSFVPLARIDSDEPLGSYPAGDVHLWHEPHWDMPADAAVVQAHVDDWRQTRRALREAAHTEARQQRVAMADRRAGSDRIGLVDCDHLGTPLSVRDASGRTLWSARYKAWGEVFREDVREVAQPLRFQGQYEDAETGFFYNRHRYYEPAAGRYLTPDPIALLGGINLYAYARNPVQWVDPLGLATTKGGCDPCCGKNPAAEALGFQTASPTNTDYIHQDVFENVVLKKGTILYSLVRGAPPGFGVTNHALIKAKGDAQAYHDLVQVKSKDLPPGRSMRTEVGAYRLTEDLCVAKGKALANTQFGAGGGTQYYVSAVDTPTLKAGKVRKI